MNPIACAYCGIESRSGLVEINHFLPLFASDEQNNVQFVCANCNLSASRTPPEMEFVAFLAGLVKGNEKYSGIELEKILGKETRFRADIVATRMDCQKQERLLIECKSGRFASLGKIEDVINQLKEYVKLLGECQPVLAIPATLDQADVRRLQAAGIELWDLDYLSANFAEQLKSAPNGYFTLLLKWRNRRGHEKTKEQLLLDSLRTCEPGKRDWSMYQSLVGDILEILFCPPLMKPFSEHSDTSMTNRRDFVVPNYAENGFWAFLRNRYIADYIVVDAKNYSRKIKKAEVLQVANYLKAQGTGLFGMIFSRHGGDAAGCAHTLREQWLIHGKMIIVLNDADVEAMLRAKEDGRTAEELVGKKIEEFRLSM